MRHRKGRFSSEQSQANLRAAEIILEDVGKFGGPESGLCLWAADIVRKHEQEDLFKLTEPGGES